MIVFAIIIGILVLLFLLILTMPAQLGIEYENLDGKQKLVLHIRLLMIPLKINIPIMKSVEKKERKKKKEKNKKQKTTLSSFRSVASGLKTAYNETKDNIKEILSEIRSKTEFQTISLRLGFGLSNAAKTGIATGAAWASSSCILSVLNRMFRIHKIDLNVSPDFNREYFHLHIKSILRLRPVHIISISIRIIKIVNLFIEKMDIK